MCLNADLAILSCLNLVFRLWYCFFLLVLTTFAVLIRRSSAVISTVKISRIIPGVLMLINQRTKWGENCHGIVKILENYCATAKMNANPFLFKDKTERPGFIPPTHLRGTPEDERRFSRLTTPLNLAAAAPIGHIFQEVRSHELTFLDYATLYIVCRRI